MTYDPEQYLVRKAARQAEKAALAAMPELRNRDDDGEALADVIARLAAVHPGRLLYWKFMLSPIVKVSW